MGLDASVRCRCWEEKRASPPSFAASVVVDAQGYITLDLPWEDHQKEHALFDEWLLTCCPHKEMDYAWERISNWGGYRLFQQKLAEIGWAHFPTLRAEIPDVNGRQRRHDFGKRIGVGTPGTRLLRVARRIGSHHQRHGRRYSRRAQFPGRFALHRAAGGVCVQNCPCIEQVSRGILWVRDVVPSPHREDRYPRCDSMFLAG